MTTRCMPHPPAHSLSPSSPPWPAAAELAAFPISASLDELAQDLAHFSGAELLRTGAFGAPETDFFITGGGKTCLTNADFQFDFVTPAADETSSPHYAAADDAVPQLAAVTAALDPRAAATSASWVSRASSATRVTSATQALGPSDLDLTRQHPRHLPHVHTSIELQQADLLAELEAIGGDLLDMPPPVFLTSAAPTSEHHHHHHTAAAAAFDYSPGLVGGTAPPPAPSHTADRASQMEGELAAAELAEARAAALYDAAVAAAAAAREAARAAAAAAAERDAAAAAVAAARHFARAATASPALAGVVEPHHDWNASAVAAPAPSSSDGSVWAKNALGPDGKPKQKRRPKTAVPDSEKDEAYYEYRHKNTERARRSRLKKKLRELQSNTQAVVLDEQRLKLEAEYGALAMEYSAGLRQLLGRYQAQPSILPDSTGALLMAAVYGQQHQA